MRFLNYLLLLGCLILLPSALSANIWTGLGQTNDWTDPGNWSPQQVPGAGDEAVIPIGKQAKVNGAIAVGSLLLAGGLIGDGDPNSKLTIIANFSWTSGSVAVPIYLENGCAALWTGSLGLGANLFNSGEINVSGEVAVDYAILTNEANGTLNLTGPYRFQVVHNPAIIENYGTLKRTGLGGIFNINVHLNNYAGATILVEAGELYDNLRLDNYGDIQVAAGALLRTHEIAVYDGTTISGDGTFNTGGNGFFANNTSNLDVNVAETMITGQGIKASGAVSFTQHVVWTDGTLLAAVSFAPSCVVDINPGSGRGITNTTTNNGTMHFNAGMGFSTGLLVNNGAILIHGAYTIGVGNASAGIYNHGTFTKPAGSPGTFTMNVPLRNESDGTIAVEGGELYLGNLVNYGSINVSAGASLRTYSASAYEGATFSGAGTYKIQTNGLTANNTTTLTLGTAEIELDASIGGTGPVAITGHVDWTSGSFNVPVNIATGSVVDMNPGGLHGISNTTTNNGTLNVNTSFTLSAGQVDNYGLISLNGPHTIGIYYGTPGIFNHGTLKKTGATPGIYNMGVPLTNHSDGSVLVETGTLLVASDFSNAGSLLVSAGATFQANRTIVQDGAAFAGEGLLKIAYNGLNANNTGAVSIDIASVDIEANLNGTGALVFGGQVNWINGSFGAPVTIGAGGTLHVQPGNFKNNGNALTINGVMNVSAPFSNTGTLQNNHALNMLVTGTFGGGGTLHNAGTLLKNATGDLTLQMTVNNTGTIPVAEGNLFLGGLSNAGNITIAAGAVVSLTDYGNNSFEAGGTITGDGTFTLAANLTVNADQTLDIQVFNLSGYYGLGGTGVLTFTHQLNWMGGGIGNPIVIAAGAALDVAGPDAKSLGAVLTNQGTVNCGSNIGLDFNGLILNNGTFHVTEAVSLGAPYNYYTSGQFNNAGTVDKTSTGTAYFNLFFNNQTGGSLLLDSGELEVGRLDNAGSVELATGTLLIVKDGNALAGGTLTGTGTLRLAGSGWYLNNSLTVNTLMLEIDANLNAAPGVVLEVQGAAQWISGSIYPAVNIANSGTFAITGYGYHELNGTLTNAGTVQLSTTVSTNAALVNTGTFQFTNESGSIYGYGGPAFANSGTIAVNTTYASTIGIPCVNSGTISIEATTLNFYTNLINNASIAIGSAATLALSSDSTWFNIGSNVTGAGNINANGVLTLVPDFTFTGELFTLYGELVGPGKLTINQGMDWRFGHIQTDVDIPAGATLLINGSSGGGVGSRQMSAYGQILSAQIHNSGTTTQYGAYDMDNGTFLNDGQIHMYGAGILDGGNGGLFTNNGDWNVNYSLDMQVNSVNNGTLKGEGNFLTFDPELDNNGTVAPGFSPGQMLFYHNYENGSALHVEVESAAGPGYGHDYVSAEENILLGGDLVVSETGTPLNGNYVILHCNGGSNCLTGTFASVSLPTDYTIAYTGQEVILTKGQPAAVSPADTTICSGNAVTLTASAGDTYAWSTGATTASIEVYPYNTTTYYVTVYDASGVGSLGSATVVVAEQPYGYIDPYYAYICQGESVLFTAYGGDTYLWSTGETTQSIQVNPTEETGYFVTLTNAQGCTASVSTFVYLSGVAVTPNITGVPASICQSEGAVALSVYQDGYYGQWSGNGVADEYFDPAGLTGLQTLTFTPAPGQCATAATWTIEVSTSENYYADADSDGFGDPTVFQTSCTPVPGYVPDNTDCDDANANIHPNAAETCNGVDDDCDGQTDEGGQQTYYADADGDGYGDATASVMACTAPGGYVSDNTDCDDANANIHPNAAETCNGMDDDCDGQTDEGSSCDGDGDGFTVGQGDCDDSNAAIYPDAPDICDNIDNDCDGLVDENTPVIDPVVATNVACGGGNTGAIDITVNSGLPPYTYRWSNNKTTQDLINLAAGTYTVTVTGGGTCTASATAVVHPKLKLVMSKTNVTCNGGADGTATATVTDGTPDYSYLWENGETTAEITGLSTGTYRVTIADQLGCTRSGSVSVGQPAAIGISGQVQAVTCNGAANGVINVTLNNGVAPFTYLWSDGGDTEDRTDLPAGTYALTVTDDNGCTRAKSFTVTQPSALTLSFSYKNVSCNGAANGEITASAAGGVKYPTSNTCNGERYCYTWSNGANTRKITELVPGVYGLTVTDANGCSIEGSVTIEEPSLLSITGVEQVLLPNGKYMLTISAEGGILPYKYKRTPGGGYQNSNVFNNVPVGVYQMFVRDANLCEQFVEVNVPNLPQRTAGGSETAAWSSQEANTEAINPANNLMEAKIFPNPASSDVTIALEQTFLSGNIRVFDLKGRLVLEQELASEMPRHQFNVSVWDAGVYLVHLQTEQGRKVLRLVVAKSR